LVSEVTSGIPPGFALRDAIDDDRWELIGLVASCWAEYPGCIMDVHGEVPELLAIQSHFQHRGGRFWAVTEHEHLVASVGIAPATAASTVLLEKLYVARAARRRGLGAALIDIVEADAILRRATTIELWSDTRFEDAHRIYRRKGYEQLPETRELHDLSQSVELHFRKRL
jgi:putative acetyltransferase